MKARVDTNEIEKEMEKTKRYMDAIKRINELEEELEQLRKRKSNKVTAE
jgi:hypothetical protein